MTKVNLFLGIAAAAALGAGGLHFFQSVILTDRTAPEFICSQDVIECTIDATDSDLCAGLTASDNRDGDLTDQIMVNEIKTIDSIESASYTDREFEISYLVFDEASNMATCSRTLVYTDYVNPRFSILQPLQFTSFSDADENLSSYLTAADCIEGDLSTKITLEFSDEYLQFAGDGSYLCSASVRNSFGVTSTIPLVIDVISDDADASLKRPDIVLTRYILYLNQGDPFNPKDYFQSLTIAGINYGSEISISNEVDTNTPGSYIVRYAYTNPDSQVEGTANLVVIVE